MEVETFKHAGCTVRIGLEEDSSFADPRDCDNPSLMFCWHPNYVLGDEQFTSTGRGGSGPQFDSMEEVPAYLREERGAVGPILPLYLYDHSGITISAGEPNPFTFDAAGWDTTMVGFACAPEERIAACCGDGAEYRTDEWIDEMLRTEVNVYDAFLRGSVYWYVVENADGESVGGCGGFLVVEEADMEGMRAEARAEAEAEAHDVAVNAEPDMELAVREATR